MVTIFSIPKPFQGPAAITQKNAIQSWLALHREAEILLFGDEPGTGEMAGINPRITHIRAIAKNKLGTPFVNDAFEKATRRARCPLLCYAAADIILFSDVLRALRHLHHLAQFLMLCRRTDMDVAAPIVFNEQWETDIRELARKNGRLHGYSAMDVMLFPKTLPLAMPTFLIGRPGWDNGWVYSLIRRKIPIIDATEAMLAIHQNHTYVHHRQGKRGVWRGEEARYNFTRAGGLTRMATILNAQFLLTKNGLTAPLLWRRWYATLSLSLPIRVLFGVKRYLYNKLPI